MLSTSAPFPQPGSYALLMDDTPTDGIVPMVELVRIHMADATAAPDEPTVRITFPLRDGATGTRRVNEEQLIDGTPLTQDETREMHELDRFLTDRPASKYADKWQRRDALRNRHIHSRTFTIEMAKLKARNARNLRSVGGSTGSRLSRDVA